jgi:hypothetical protein
VHIVVVVLHIDYALHCTDTTCVPCALCCDVSGDEAWADIRCVATDGGSSFASTLNAVLPGIPRLLCLFHINENIRRHLLTKLTLVGKWTAFHLAWWNILTEMRSEAEFDVEWSKLMAAFPPAKEYLSRHLHPNRKLWCGFWTRQYTAFGAVSTQRSESVHRVVKYFEETNSTLEALFTIVLSIAQEWEQNRVNRLHQDRYTTHSASGPVYVAAVQYLTREAADFVYEESQYMMEYDVVHYQSLPSGCSASLSASSSTRAYYQPHPSYLSAHAVQTQSINSDSAVNPQAAYSTDAVHLPSDNGKDEVHPQSRHGADAVPRQSTTSTDAVHEPSLSSASTVPRRRQASPPVVDVYHPHSFQDLPDEGVVYCVRHRIPDQAFATHWVRVRQGSASCTDCKRNTNFVLPCRHILAVNLKRWPQASVFQPGQCHRRWWLEHDSTAVTLPSMTALLGPLHDDPVDLDLVAQDNAAEGVSKDGIYCLWIATAERASGFIQQHGEGGLRYSLAVLEQLISNLSSGGPGVPLRYRVTITTQSHTSTSVVTK